MAQIITCATKTNDGRDGCSTDSTLDRRLAFHSTKKQPSPVFNNGAGKYSLQTLTPNSNHSQSSERAFSSPLRNNQIGDLFEQGVESELNLGFTFRTIGAGLENLGNTCFLNSVLQCLTYTEPFAAYLQSGKHKRSCHVAGFCAMCAIQNHVRCALESTGRILAPKYLVTNLRSISRNFRSARQEDAHEYMVNLLESMHKCCLPSGLPSESPIAYEKSLVHKIFGGRLRSQVKCMECSYGSNKYDPFLDLSLEIAKSSSLLKALLHFTNVEQLDGGEKQYQCQSCNQKVRAVRRLTIDKAPYVLTIHLKRFGSFIPGQKIDKKVEFGPTLDLKPFVTGTYEGDLKYTLYGVLVHAGWSTHSGHYYCFVRTSSGVWYVLDDNEVFPVSERDVLGQKAYMLFYVRDRSNLSLSKPVAVVQKENSALNDVENKKCSVSILGYNDAVQNGMSANSSSSVSPPMLAKVDVAASGSTDSNRPGFGSKSSVIDGSVVSVDIVDSVLNVISAKCSVNSHTCSTTLPRPVPSVVEDGGTIPHPTDAKPNDINEHKETKTINKPDRLPQIASLLGNDDNVISHSTGAENKAVNEHTGTADVKDGGMKAHSAGSDNVISHSTGAEMKAVNEHTGTSVVKYGGMKAHSAGVKTEAIAKCGKILVDLTVPTTTLHHKDSVLQEFASKTSDTDIQHENASLNETKQRKAVCDKASGSGPREDDSMQLSSKSGTENVLRKVIGDFSSKVADTTQLSIQLGAEEVLRKSVNDIRPETVDCTLSSQSGNKESLCKRVRNLVPEEVGSRQLSVHLSTEEMLCKKTGDVGPGELGFTPLSSQHGTKGGQAKSTFPEEAHCKVSGSSPEIVDLALLSRQSTEEKLCQRVSVTIPEQDDSKLSPSQSDSKDALCKEVDGLRSGEVGLMQISDQFGTEEALCKSINHLEPREVSLMHLSSLQGTLNGQNGGILNDNDSTDRQNTEDSAKRPEKAKSVNLSTQSSTGNKFDQKERLDHLHAKKVLKPQKHWRKLQVAIMHARSSLLFRSSLCKKKKHKRRRKHSLEYAKSAQKAMREESSSGFEASTSNRTGIGAFDSSPSQIRQQGNSCAKNMHDSYASNIGMDHSECATQIVEVNFKERIDHTGAVLASNETSLERYSSTLVANNCNSRETDGSQNKRNSIQDFMNMLTRGLEETSVARWNRIGFHPSQSLGLCNKQSINIGYAPDKWDVEYDRGKRKKVRSTENGSGEEITAKKSRLKKAKRDQSSSSNQPYRI